MGFRGQLLLMIIGVMCYCAVPLLVRGQHNLPDSQQQISAAVSAAPENLQQEATVLGYDADTTLATLREGTNELICLADDPRDPNFHVACYHNDLEPFMKRGRELREKGMSRKEVDLIRRSEIKSGALPMPEKPMALYSLSGSEGAFDYEAGRIEEAAPRYVIYVPYATEESTGLPAKPVSKGAPWIMEPGTPWAHIMVIPGRSIEQ
ncbi:hypothetical protein LQ318_15740 [Aliifodinibius salicampi]|uniref:Uncharacterized protein n=1 Tax=Fodinibius salicampi TaxID=1920655 RepID=A0ABT3Q2T6_9BACT|nr:hypothetical protein [Fodinibius salicampi]MCW9714361.1 hypothetical protein [Fodinibius salicampi]